VRILAIDPGTVRCGLAVSDPLGILATPLEALPVGDGRDLAVRLAARAAELEAARIVVGYPLNMDGTEGPRAQASVRLAEALRAVTAIPVELVDERLTSFEAEERLHEAGRRPRGRVRSGRAGRRDAQVDSAAAAVLLQRVLERPAR